MQKYQYIGQLIRKMENLLYIKFKIMHLFQNYESEIFPINNLLNKILLSILLKIVNEKYFSS